MSILSFIPVIGKFLDGALGIVDQIVPDKDKANEIKAKIKEQILVQQHDELIKEMETITERWKSDNEHFITRLVRPAMVAWSYFLFTLVIMCDGNIGSFHINPAYIPILQTIVVTVTVAFFGSRGIEKVTKIVKKGNMNE